MASGEVAAWAAAIAATASAVAAWLSWRSERKAFITQGLLSKDALKTAAFETRYAVYSDVQAFMLPWGRDGRPDLSPGSLSTLIRAWDRSRFLFEPEVTQFIRQIWLDAVKADHAARVISDEFPGDRQDAIQFKYDRFGFYFDEKGDLPYDGIFYRIFSKELSIPSPLAPSSIARNN